MVENVAMPQSDFRETGHSSLRTPKANAVLVMNR
jgi:hypothetical protein